MRVQFLEAGEIVTTHGIRGEIKVLPWADGPDFLLDFTRVRIKGIDYEVENCRVQKTCNLLKLQGVETVEQAQKLIGKTVEVYREDADPDAIYISELLGISVYSNDVCIGKVEDVLDYPGNKVYVVKGKREYMIPAVKEFVLKTDLDQDRMDVKLIEGMATDEN